MTQIYEGLGPDPVPKQSRFSTGHIQYKGQNFVHRSVEILFFPPIEVPSNAAAGPLGVGWERLRPASRFPLTLVMTRSVAVNCEPLLKVENSIRFHGHPREVKFCYRAMAVKWSLPGSCLATQKAARRPPTGAIPALPLGQQGWEDVSPSSPASLSAPPKARLGPQRTRRPLPRFFPCLCPGAAWKGS